MPHLHVCMFCFVVYSSYNDQGQEYLEVQLSKQSAEFTAEKQPSAELRYNMYYLFLCILQASFISVAFCR